jgi:hypothetical protein
MNTKLELASLFLSASAFALSGLAGCAADTTSETADDEEAEVVDTSEDALAGGPSNFGYFIVTRRDMRRCIAPLCGGFFVKRVNEAKTLCADGSRQDECYVESIKLTGIGLSAREEADLRFAVESGKALVKAKTYKKKWNGITLGTLKANEGWLGATGSTPDGTFYRTAHNGIVCITAPCPSTSAYALNGKDQHNLIDVVLDQTATPASPESINAAQSALGTKEGILIAGGIQLPKCIPGSMCGPKAVASEFYLRVTRREGKACGSWAGTLCNAGQFCRWTQNGICGAADAPGKCSYKPDVCNKMFAPVCGCGGNTYGNECMAHAAGTSAASSGACVKK